MRQNIVSFEKEVMCHEDALALYLKSLDSDKTKKRVQLDANYHNDSIISLIVHLFDW